VDDSIPGLDALVGDLRPGAARLAQLAPVVRTTTRELLEVAPIATSALRRARGSTPDVTRLLAVGTPFSGRARGLLKQSAPVIGCLRPYAPEIAGFAATWGDFNASYDATGHFARVIAGANPIANGTSSSPAQTIAANPQLRYAMPRPPGENVGQPWYQPQCGVTRDALDPANDPEGAP